jgi:hypothetical protein
MMKEDQYHPPVTHLKGLSLSSTIRDELHIAALRMGMTAARLEVCEYGMEGTIITLLTV